MAETLPVQAGASSWQRSTAGARSRRVTCGAAGTEGSLPGFPQRLQSEGTSVLPAELAQQNHCCMNSKRETLLTAGSAGGQTYRATSQC